MRCQNPRCRNGVIVDVEVQHWRNGMGPDAWRGGSWIRVEKPCPDCIGGIAHCCDGITAANDPEANTDEG